MRNSVITEAVFGRLTRFRLGHAESKLGRQGSYEGKRWN
jgi:hypothetical protein